MYQFTEYCNAIYLVKRDKRNELPGRERQHSTMKILTESNDESRSSRASLLPIVRNNRILLLNMKSVEQTGKRKERPLTSYFVLGNQSNTDASKWPKTNENSAINQKLKLNPDTVTESGCDSEPAKSCAVEQVQQERTNHTEPQEPVSANEKNPKETVPHQHLRRKIPRNIVYQLIHRSIHGQKRKIGEIYRPWKPVPWIELRPNDISGELSVKCAAWDEDGILLAVAYDDQKIRVYDWDTTIGSDMAMRNQYLRENKPFKRIIEPILTISLSSRFVSSMQWNPYNPDELAVVCW